MIAVPSNILKPPTRQSSPGHRFCTGMRVAIAAARKNGSLGKKAPIFETRIMDAMKKNVIPPLVACELMEKLLGHEWLSSEDRIIGALDRHMITPEECKKRMLALRGRSCPSTEAETAYFHKLMKEIMAARERGNVTAEMIQEFYFRISNAIYNANVLMNAGYKQQLMAIMNTLKPAKNEFYGKQMKGNMTR